MPTFKDIAKLAGVSYGTVSNVLNKRGNVSLEKIKLVEKAAAELNYYKNEKASELRSNKKTDVALIIPVLDDFKLRKIYSLLLKKLTQLNLKLNLYITDFNPTTEEECFKLSLATNRYVIVNTCMKDYEKFYSTINCKDSKVVLINNQKPIKKKGFFLINFNEDQLFNDLLNYINNNNYQRVLFFSDNEFIDNIPFHNEKIEFLTCLQPYNISTSIDVLSNKSYDLIITTSLEKYESVMSARKILQLDNNMQVILIADYDIGFDMHALLYYQDTNLLVEKLVAIIEKKITNEGVIKLPYSGFVSHNKKANKDDFINLLMIESPTTSALLKVKSFIEQKLGLKINIDVIKYNQYDILYDENLMKRYDLIRIDMAYLSEVAEKVFKPLTSNYKHILDTFIDNLDEYTYYKNTMYALPFDISCILLMYRSDILNNQIIKRQYYEQTKNNNIVPKNYDEYNNLELFINDNYGDVFKPSTVCIGSSLTCGGEFLIRVDEDDIIGNDGNLDFDNEKVKKALNSYLLSVSLSKNSNNQFWDDVVKEYAQGNTIMSLVYSNYIHMLKDFNKEILYKTDYTYPPTMKSLIGGGIIGLSKHTNKDSLCYMFLETLYSAQISKLITHLGGTLPTKSIYRDISLVSIYPWLKLIPNIMLNNTRIHNNNLGNIYKTIEFEKNIGRQVKQFIINAKKELVTL